MNDERYPWELLASIAAQLLKNENYEDAVRKARRLVAEVRRQEGTAYREDQQERREREARENFASASSRLARLPTPIACAKALREITGTDNETDATKSFRELRTKQLRLRAEWSQALSAVREDLSSGVPTAEIKNGLEKAKQSALPETISSLIEQEIIKRKETGFSAKQVSELRSEYLAAFPRRGPKPRKKK